MIKLLEEWHRGNTTAVEERLVVEEEPAERGEQPKRKEDSWTEINSGNIKKAVQEWLRDPKCAAEKYGPIKSWGFGQSELRNTFGWKELTNGNIKGAVQEWLGDPKSAAAKYGPIGFWDVSQVTNMDELFKDAKDFNEDIAW